MRLGKQETAEQRQLRQWAEAQEAQAQHQRAHAALPLERQANVAWAALHQQNDGLQQQGQQLAEWDEHHASEGGETEDGQDVLSGFTAALEDVHVFPLTAAQRPFLLTAGLADSPTADSLTALASQRAASDKALQWLRDKNVKESTSEELAVIFK